MLYGDSDNVTKDSKALYEIISRQGFSLLLEVIAESVGKTVIQYKLKESEIAELKESIITELQNAINERT